MACLSSLNTQQCLAVSKLPRRLRLRVKTEGLEVVRKRAWLIVNGDKIRDGRITFWFNFSITSNGCWVWNMVPHNESAPYGRILVKGRRWYAHRYSWTIHNGRIPKGLDVLHRCDNYRCVNPGHLFLGIHRDNMRDSLIKGRFNRQKIRPPQVREIRRLRREGHTLLVIGKKYGLTIGAICQICLRHLWPWVR